MNYKFKNTIKRIVVKVGTSSLTKESGLISMEKVKLLVDDIVNLRLMGYEVILVSSGAVGAGIGRIGENSYPKTLPLKQAIASIGQVQLMELYNKLFFEKGFYVGQLLLTASDLENKKRSLNAQNTLRELVKLGAIPIINENDSVATEEIKVGDNDTLGAKVCALSNSDLLILLTDIDGLYDGNPNEEACANLIPEVLDINQEIRGYCQDKGSEFSTGGMNTKLNAGEIGMETGFYCVIANSSRKNILADILKGNFVGTVFVPKKKLNGHLNKWLVSGAKSKGAIIVDAGCESALLLRGASVLPVGIKDIQGSFVFNDVIDIINLKGEKIGSGISFYDSVTLKAIKGLHGSEIEEKLRENYEFVEAIHRDNLMVLRRD